MQRWSWKTVRKALVLATVILSPTMAQAQGTLFVEGDNVGLGIETPATRLHLLNGLITLGVHTFGERPGVPTDIEARAARNYILLVDDDNNSTNAGLVVSRDGNPNAVFFHVKEDGTSGINRQSSSFPFQVGTNSTNGNGAHVTKGGVWTNGSSRASKTGITELDSNSALAAFAQLEPVRFRYRGEPNEEYLGFVAEDVPELVAQNDRHSLSPMDMVALLTRVVQEQQTEFQGYAAKIAELERELTRLKELIEAP